jgi:hypothetical protein
MAGLMSMPAFSQPRLGDAEWRRRFRSFVRLFNAFVESLNDGKFDFERWREMRVAWGRLESE